jgi:hypothetical protein
MVSLSKPALPLKLEAQIRHYLYFSMIISAFIKGATYCRGTYG